MKERRLDSFRADLAQIFDALPTSRAKELYAAVERRVDDLLFLPRSCPQERVGKRGRRRRVAFVETCILWYRVDEAKDELVLERIRPARRVRKAPL